MSRQEVIEHIGTIAKSGSREFLRGLGSRQPRALDAQHRSCPATWRGQVSLPGLDLPHSASSRLRTVPGRDVRGRAGAGRTAVPALRLHLPSRRCRHQGGLVSCPEGSGRRRADPFNWRPPAVKQPASWPGGPGPARPSPRRCRSVMATGKLRREARFASPSPTITTGGGFIYVRSITPGDHSWMN